ncbi:MAG: alpha/beta hydrolase [Pseudomonadota bacterium]
MTDFITSPDPQWLDRMYNNRALVPDHAVCLNRLAALSSEARQQLPGHLDLRYGDAPGERLDIFPASGTVQNKKGAPVLLMVHGGYWRAMDKSDHSYIAPSFTQAGACVVVVNYDLLPAVSVQQIMMQVVKSVAWVYRNASRFGGDPDRITVVGHSVGGYMAAMLLGCAWKTYAADLPATLVKNAMAISGLYDLQPLTNTPFIREAIGLSDREAKSISPAFFPAPRKASLYAVAGADESAEFLRQNLLIQKAWGEKVVPVCESHLGLNHFTVLDSLAEPSHRMHRLVLDLLGKTA